MYIYMMLCDAYFPPTDVPPAMQCKYRAQAECNKDDAITYTNNGGHRSYVCCMNCLYDTFHKTHKETETQIELITTYLFRGNFGSSASCTCDGNTSHITVMCF